MGEESNNAENKEKTEATAEKVFTLEILPMIRHAQQQHGLRHGDYQRYRGYCTRRIRRLRKTLKFPQGDKRHFKRKDVTVAQFTGKRADERYAHIPLMCAERAWAYAMQLKQEANTEARKRFHLIHKLRKACVYTLQLQELVKSEYFDARSKLECEAYVSWIHGSLHFELQLWQTSGEHLKRAQLVYEQLAKALPEEEQELYRAKVNEFLPNLRYCAYNIGGEGVEGSKAANKAANNVDELLGLRAQGLLDNIEVLISQTKLSGASALQTFDWQGNKITVRSEKVRVFLLASQELDKSLENKRKPEERIALIERVLIDCKDAIQAVKDEMRADPKLRAAAGQTVNTSIQNLMSYLLHLRYKRTLQRNLCLVEQTKQNFLEATKSADTDTKEVEKKGKNGNLATSSEGKKVRPQDFARLYEIILQNVNDLQQIRGMEENSSYQSEISAWATTFKAFRCYYIALTLYDMKKWREAVALYERATKYAEEALQQLKTVGNDEFKMSTPLRDLVDTIERSKFQAHAHSVLEDSSEGASGSVLPNLNKTNQKSSAGKSKPLYENLSQYKEDQSLHTQQPNVFNLVPELQAIPCKPLFFDLSLNYVEMPSLEDKLHSPKKQNTAGISGFVKGFLGWGGNK